MLELSESPELRSKFISQRLSSYLALASLILCGVLPIIFTIFYSVKASEWTQKVFQETYGSLLEGIDIKQQKKILVLAPCIFFLRRLLLSVFAILLKEWLALQLMSLCIVSMAVLIFMLHVLPNQPFHLLFIEAFNETVSLILI